MAELTLRVITPDRIALDEPIDAVRIPGVDGSLGILKRHAPMVAALDAGLLRYRAGGDDRTLFVSGGFAEVRDNTVRIVTEASERHEEISVERAREAEERARKRLDEGRQPAGQPVDLVRAELALRRALVRQRLGRG